VDATGQVISSSGQLLPAASMESAHCHKLLALHTPCPCNSCHIREAFQTSRPVDRQLHHPVLGDLLLRIQPLIDPDGQTNQAILHITPDEPPQTDDPTDLVRQALSCLPQPVFECDLQGRLHFANPRCIELFRFTKSESDQNICLQQLFVDTDRQRLEQLRERSLQEEQPLSDKFTAKNSEGQSVPVLLHLIPVKKQGRFVIIRGMIEDRSQLTNTEQALCQLEGHCQKLTRHDQLTGLPNRSQFFEWLDQALERCCQGGKPLAVVLLDIDRFKQVVDSLGDDCGDQVLCEVALRLSKKMRFNDMLARINGDEFALVCSNTSRPDSLTQLVQRLSKELQSPLQVGEHVVHLTASIGIVISLPEDQDSASLLRQATIAMNEAKQQGGNRHIHFLPQMQRDREISFLFEKHMREALQRHEFYLHYQPQIDLVSGRISGVEALARWAGPNGDNPSPEIFINVAETSGLIHPLGDFILHQACAQNRHWQQSGLPPIQVTVNISAKQFAQQDFVDKVLQTLKDTGLAPEWLELEITESAIMANIEEALGTMHRLRQVGVRFAIDDFGTGHSSLNYLRHLALSKLKIDRSFLHEIPGNRDNEKLVFSILALARSFDLQTVAEGIETKEQLNYLQQLDCDLGQGYLFSRPVTPDAIPVLLAKHNS
jgi:diguanylate cyclase (GGDEF)-like protein/PAS domain S-box-containing protein